MIRLTSGRERAWEKAGEDYLSGDAITLPDQALVLARDVTEATN
jgi:hypothetical protein